jgi:hypothetical protein
VTKRTLLIYFLLTLTLGQICFAQQPQQAQPLNANVSDFGTSFIFSPPPICSGCMETEFGFTALNDGRVLSSVITIAPFKSKTDFSVLANVFDSEAPSDHRVAHFGDRLDFVIRQQVFTKEGFVLTIAPRGTVFLRDTNGGRIGGTVAAQYGKGNNLVIANFTLTKALSNPSDACRNDYQGSFDYYRSLDQKGAAFFVGVQHEYATRLSHAVGTEQGFLVPFRNGQVEFAIEELALNGKPVIQLQARVIANWGRIFRK